jgi:hypothetical protein
MQQPQNALHYTTLHCAAFLVLRSGLFYLPFLTPPPSPTTTPKRQFKIIEFALPSRFLNCQISKLPKWKYGKMAISSFRTMIFCPTKKEYAKLAIPLSGSKGQALRVFEKKYPPFR